MSAKNDFFLGGSFKFSIFLFALSAAPNSRNPSDLKFGILTRDTAQQLIFRCLEQEYTIGNS